MRASARARSPSRRSSPQAGPASAQAPEDEELGAKSPKGTYRAWAELLARTFEVDVLECPSCKGRM
ncbi:MAG: hypothetical protein WKF41_19080 [Gaiellaceae bacterium]